MAPRWSAVLALGAIACGPAPAPLVDDVDFSEQPSPADGAAPEGRPPANFSFVLRRSLAGLAKPGTGRQLEADLTFLKQQGIDLLVSLTVEPIDPALVADSGMEPLHLPVVDFTAPRMEQLSEFVAAADPIVKSGGAVAVHCTAGLGRTGTFLAAYFAAHGMKPEEAMEKIRELRPGSIETRSQEQAIVEFYKIAAGGR